jgi:hypothetical protein
MLLPIQMPNSATWLATCNSWIDSDASYLNAPHARSRIGGHHYLSNAPPRADIKNGAILNPLSVLKVVVSSTAEAKYTALFKNGKAGILERTTLEELGHTQGHTWINTDNSTTCGITNDSVKQQCSCTMDMWFHWICDRVKQGQFEVNWEPSKSNRGDYFTSTSPPQMTQLLTCSLLSAPSALDSAVRVCWNPSHLARLGFPISSSDPFSLGPHANDSPLN